MKQLSPPPTASLSKHKLLSALAASVALLLMVLFAGRTYLLDQRATALRELRAQRALDIDRQAHDERMRTEDLVDAYIADAEQRFDEVPELTSSELREMRLFLNPVHLQNAVVVGVDPPASRQDIEPLVQTRHLVELEANPRYTMEPMTHSVPVVVAPALHLLNDLGENFHERLAARGLPKAQFLISSATRSGTDQRRLRGVNGNAARNSAHQYGTTVDILYSRFAWDTQEALQPPKGAAVDAELFDVLLRQRYEELVGERSDGLKAVLARALIELQTEGNVVIVYERRQPVFHITVTPGQRIPSAQGLSMADSGLSLTPG